MGGKITYMMCTSDTLHSVYLMNMYLCSIKGEEIKELIGVMFKLFSSLDIAVDSRSDDLKVLGRQSSVFVSHPSQVRQLKPGLSLWNT